MHTQKIIIVHSDLVEQLQTQWNSASVLKLKIKNIDDFAEYYLSILLSICTRLPRSSRLFPIYFVVVDIYLNVPREIHRCIMTDNIPATLDHIKMLFREDMTISVKLIWSWLVISIDDLRVCYLLYLAQQLNHYGVDILYIWLSE